MSTRYRIAVDVTEDDLRALHAAARSAGESNVTAFVKSLVLSVRTGVERPGSWERAWVRKLCYDLEKHVDFVDYPWRQAGRHQVADALAADTDIVEVQP